MEINKIYLGDCLEVMKDFPDNSVDSIVTDPPAGIGFMGKEWDSDKGGSEMWIRWLSIVMSEALRVLKPGGHALVWALPRTSHWTGTALENAGFEVRDCVYHLFGSGFPKSLDISKAIDKQAGAEREVIGTQKLTGTARNKETRGAKTSGALDHEYTIDRTEMELTAPSTPEAKQWQGWGTALKPAVECWWLVRKPLSEKTVAQNVLKHGTGGLNIDGSRIPVSDLDKEDYLFADHSEGHSIPTVPIVPSNFKRGGGSIKGRFPANLIHDGSDVVLAEFPDTKTGWTNKDIVKQTDYNIDIGGARIGQNGIHYPDNEGSAARFFYTAKPSSAEKNLLFDSTLTVKYNSGICKEENMVLVRLLKKVISDSDRLNLSIDESGENITAQCQLDSLSTILTTISGITTSQILLLLMPLLIKESIVVANSEKVNGGNLATSAEKQKSSPKNIGISQKKVGLNTADVERVISGLLLTLTNEKNWKEVSNSHPTPKAQSLMQYLIRLVTPPKGIVLDPFAGSGSTLLAAKTLGHPYIGIEIDKDYCAIAEARLKQGVLNF